jgi:hypothetical protein
LCDKLTRRESLRSLERARKVMPATNGKPEDFPEAESFQDCCGIARAFELDLLVNG